MSIQIYTDGSCLGNPGPGGWAFLLKYNGKEIRVQDGEPHTTNNRMELTAVIEGIAYAAEHFPEETELSVYSDSAWVVNTMTKNWKRKKNLDLWERLMPLLPGKHIQWNWVKGHAGHEENEDCDQRAYAVAEQMKKVAATMDPSDRVLPGESPGLF